MPARCRIASCVALSVLVMVILGASQAESLLTKEDVEGVLGIAVEVGTRGNDGSSFTSSDPLGSVTIDGLDLAVFAMVPKNPANAIEGVGDEAFFQLNMINGVVLQAVKGNSGFILSVHVPDR